MTTNFPILTTITFLPIAAALLIMLCGNIRKELICKVTALVFSLANLLLVLCIWKCFNFTTQAMQFTEKLAWIKGYNIYYSTGIDAISLYLITLTAILIPICIISSWHSIKKSCTNFMALFMLLEGLVIGTFCATDLILFYLFFEAVLIPMFFIIGIWGGNDRVYAAFKFFLYTLLGSLFMLLGVLYIYFTTGTSSISELLVLMPQQPLHIQKILWWAFFLSFAVKIPMWPVHTWLPDAHVQAPTAGSVILAGVLLKLGGYGFLRLSLPMLPTASFIYENTVFCLSVIAVIYTSLIALMQKDIKKLIAYSSIAHMGFVTAGIFSGSAQGIEGAVFQMISHGFISAALFLCVGVLYERMHTKEILFYNGLANRMPAYALVFVILTMASIGLPGTSGFVGEFLTLMAVFQKNRTYGFMLSLGMVLGAAYMLWLVARILFGPMVNSKLEQISDLTIMEKATLYPIIIAIIIIGIYPKIITSGLEKPVEKILTTIDRNNTYMINSID